MEQYTVGLCTLGCKVSQYETEAIAEDFERRGFVRRPFDEVCDVYVINTCTVTGEADRKSRQCIRRARRLNPAALIYVTGCYAQTSPGDVAAIEGVTGVTGSYGKMEIAARAVAQLSAPPCAGGAATVDVSDLESAPFEPMHVEASPRTRAYVKIEDGCECRCTYCAIPGARGRVRSKRPEDVFTEVETLARGGTREVVLTGIETASYGADLGDYRLIDLLEELESRHLVDRIRLGSLSPELMSERFCERLGALRTVTPHFHLSMQSGSDAVLRAMKRRYNAGQALAALARVRAVMPDVQFTTDMMVGFPGEGEREFCETMAFAREARFLTMHVFAYSRRKNTPAADFPDQVPEEVKAERSHRLITLGHEIRDEILDGIVKAAPELRLLLETHEGNVWRGHTDAFLEAEVALGGDRHGELVTVRPTAARDGILLCDDINSNRE